MEWAILIGAVLLLLVLPRLRMMMVSNTGVQSTNAKAEMARARVRQVKYFWIHAGFYSLTMLGGLALGLLLENTRPLVIAGVVWGLAVALHAFMVFVIHGGWVRQWERRQVDALLRDEE